MSDPSKQPEEFKRSIRSFVKREGKMTSGQKNAIELLWPEYGVDLRDEVLGLADLFKRDAFTVLEIGFGNGLSLAEMAEAHPEQNYFGVEVHTPGVGGLLVQVLIQEPMLANTAQEYAAKPSYRPLTKYENRGMNLGHGVWDLLFEKTS